MKINILLRKLYSVKGGKLLVWPSAVTIVSAAFYQMSILIDGGSSYTPDLSMFILLCLLCLPLVVGALFAVLAGLMEEWLKN